MSTKLFIILMVIFTFHKVYSADYSFEYDGKKYEIVELESSWTEAASYAKEHGGYLAQIDSQEEQDTIYSAIMNNISSTYAVVMDGGGVAYIWIGGSDINNEGTWIWDGTNTGDGSIFWKGQGSAGSGDGQSVDGSFYNWGGKSQYGSPKEPDNYNSNQHAAAIALEPWPKNMGILGVAGEWNDLSISNQLFFVVEYDLEMGVNSIIENDQESCARPNPTNDNYTEITFYANTLGIAELIITEINGKIISKSTKHSTLGENYFVVELNNLASSFYNYHITLNDKIFIGKIISN